MELTESTIIVMVYYMRRMHLNISQKKGCIGQNLGVSRVQSVIVLRMRYPPGIDVGQHGLAVQFSLGCSYIGITGECPCGCTQHPG